MPLPFFFAGQIEQATQTAILSEETSWHVVHVLRMQNGEKLNLTDGKGNLFLVQIISNDRKKCLVKIESSVRQASPKRNIHVAISLIKNTGRFEWFLEKATEIGVTSIIPMLCTRTEKQHFRIDRMQSIIVSAMIQSQQCYLPVLHEPVKFNDILSFSFSANAERLIAYCGGEYPKFPIVSLPAKQSSLICIGPEGDFTSAEVESALQKGFQIVSMGDTRLRTETAGVVASTLLCIR